MALSPLLAMNRDPAHLADATFDLLIIGGGITGAATARDAALRGLKVALIEQADFAHATSAHNSKLIHGGLRYLRNLEFALVRESLGERRIWQRIAPHLVSPLPFLVPLYGAGHRARLTLAAGLSLYDVLSFDRGWLSDPAQRLPGHAFLRATDASAREPSLRGPKFEGAFLYYDAQMYAPERLALECILAAAANGAVCANYVAAERLLLRDGRVEGARVRDLESGTDFDVRASRTLLAAGPWSDLFLEHALGHKTATRLVRSKGIHVVVPAMTRTHALTVATPHGHFFVLPWRGHTLLGTTDTAFEAPPDQLSVTERDIEPLLAQVNGFLPQADLTLNDVLHFYAGLRPLVADGDAQDTYGASRRSELIDHGKTDGIAQLYSAVGGKWTTSRRLAEQIVDYLAPQYERPLRACTTAQTPLPGGSIPRIDTFLANCARDWPGLSHPHLARLYGTRLNEVLRPGETAPELLKPIAASGDIGAQILYAVRHEMARTLEDVVMRRTGIGQLGAPSSQTLDAVVRLMAAELGWDEAR
ncbi:MAG: glycerol-3-phosphate dehydrogenase/oxidase, partial [Alphaproteobacteria bacterium]|nr:glycerol-3-phosphate dehydrogenase/oxidase [Alphaproteobacteria bacterium]